MAMFGYMTDLERVEMTQVHHIEADGDDMESLLFHFLDELLFMFSAEPYIVAKVFFGCRLSKETIYHYSTNGNIQFDVSIATKYIINIMEYIITKYIIYMIYTLK